MQIHKNVFIVTGGGSGLGLATTKYLAIRGGIVIATDLKKSEIYEEYLGDQNNIYFLETDVCNDDQMKKAIHVAKSHGFLGGLINCAGIASLEKTYRKKGPHPMDTFRRIFEINVMGTFNASRLCAEAMANQESKIDSEDGESGVIIHTASIAAFDGQLGQTAYAGSKAAVAGMTLPMARELGEYGIRVVSIAPGPFETPMTKRLPASNKQNLYSETPFPKRMGRPEEFAHLVVHILENKMLNGVVIRIDGGIRMGLK